jgi:hypothetical protein
MEALIKAVRHAIHVGASPNELLQNVFTTIDKEIDFGEVQYVLYNGKSLDYSYSHDFITFLQNHYPTVEPTNREILHCIQQFANIQNSNLIDALAIAAGENCKLLVKVVPKHRQYVISKIDGCEKVDILQAFT